MTGRDRLVTWMKRNGLSQHAVAKKIGCAQSLVGAIVNGRKRPGLDTALAIERASGGAVRAKHWETDRCTARVREAS